MDNAEQERTLRRIRRVRLAIRLIVLGGIGLALVLTVTSARREARATTGIVFLDGRTDQGHPFELMLRDGRPVHFRTGFDAPCGSTPWETVWWEREGRGVPFRFEDAVLTVDSQWPARFDDPRWSGRHRAVLRAELDRGNRVRGTMRLRGEMRGPSGRYTCESGWVAFTGARSD